jgi:hypothetical protein
MKRVPFHFLCFAFSAHRDFCDPNAPVSDISHPCADTKDMFFRFSVQFWGTSQLSCTTSMIHLFVNFMINCCFPRQSELMIRVVAAVAFARSVIVPLWARIINSTCIA